METMSVISKSFEIASRERLWLYVVTDNTVKEVLPTTGKSVGSRLRYRYLSDFEHG